MSDPLQSAVQSFAYSSSITRSAAVVCGVYLVFAMAVVWALLALWQHRRISFAVVVRVGALAILSFALSRVFGHLVSDPRPYLVEHIRPLAPTATDNGFPSDHTLLAAFLTASLVWFYRRMIPLFVIGLLLVMAGRMGIAAHHTADVVGSVAIVAVSLPIVAVVPLPRSWSRPVLQSLYAASEVKQRG